jgi:hypothetical protein
MRKLTLSIPVAVLALCLGGAQLSAQQPGNGSFQWYIGGQGGMMVFETPNQTSNGIPMGGGHLLIVARRTGLMLSVDEGFGSNELASYNDADGSVQTYAFNDIRKYSAMLMAFPLQIPIQPYFGLGVGFMHFVHPTPTSGDGSAEIASHLGSSGFGSLLGGVQFKLARFMAFGQYQITTSPSLHALEVQGGDIIAFGRMLTGPTHTFSAGIRIGLGNAKERAQSGGY